MPYTAPEFQRDAFNCPHCDAYAVMDWSQLFNEAPGGGFIPVTVHMAQCGHCGKPSYWIEKRRLDVTDQVDCQMLFPAALQASLPHSDMPARMRADYEEARNIVAESPRGAAALL